MAVRLPTGSSVPVELSTFCGRRRELAHLRTLLATDRLVTVTGTGGVGKTRLVTELAVAAAFDFPDGVWMVELARIGGADLVGTAVAEAVAAPRTAQVDALDRAARRLGAGCHLLILDNCEHVLDGAAAAAWHLLTQCPRLTILATSREALTVRGERTWPLLPLRVEDPVLPPGDPPAGLSEAVQLFCDRAQLLDTADDIAPDTARDVAEICRRLDGLPLALELAAAWVPVLSLRQILDRLDGSLVLLDRFEHGRDTRHRSIRAALDWSERLLTDAQAEALSRLSVFVGGFSLEGAEVVLRSPDGAAGSALELVASLVTRSLVAADTTTADEARYRFLEPVRQYAAEQLRAHPDQEQEARSRHLQYLAGLAEAAEDPIIGGPDQPWLRRLDAELANIRAALQWGFVNEPDTASRLATSLLVYCRHRGLFSEGVAWARQAARSTGRLRARALCMEGWLSSEMGDTAGVGTQLVEAYQLSSAGGWERELVMVLVARALAEYVAGDLEALQATAEEAVTVARTSGNDALLIWALWAPAVCAAANDDHQRANDLFSEAHAVAVRLDNVSWGSVLAINVADSAIDMGDDVASSRALRVALQSFTAVDPANAPYLMEHAAILAIRRGAPGMGLRLFGASRAALTRAGYRETQDEARRRTHWIDVARQQLDAVAADAAWEDGEGLTVAAALDEARGVVAEPAPQPAPAVQPTAQAPANSFLREGEFWALTFAGVVTRVKDSKGVRDVASLIAARGRALAAVDLVSGDHRPPGKPRVAAAWGLGCSGEGDAGEVVDAQARAQYRARLVDLEDEVIDADSCNDPERATRARDERAFLLTELGAAVGLSGRPRRSLDPAERARKAVAWRVRDAISHIEAAHPALGRHLRRSVRTGSLCVYDPAEPAHWRV